WSWSWRLSCSTTCWLWRRSRPSWRRWAPRRDASMTAVLTALGTMTLIALAGWLLATTRVLGPEAPRVLARVVFTLSTPSLLITTIGNADLDLLLTSSALTTWITTLVVAGVAAAVFALVRSEEHTSELQSRFDLVCRLLLEKK